VQDMMIMLVNS